MNLEKMIQNYKTETKVIPREEKILETIQKSKEVMMEVQSEHTMSYGEFLFSQFRLIRKRWWMLQAALLIVTFFLMNYLDDSEYLMRTLGTSSVLFIVMIIPEFWRNKESDSLQIEAACLYSLRQIYSARVFLIGVADVFMITLFMFVCCVGMRMQFMDILVQFLFPMVVAAGICFAMLNSSALNEAASMLGFNQQVKNNSERFASDFAFKLTKEEVNNLRSKNLTSSWGGSRYLPNAFTEQGIYMLMTILKGDLAVKQSIDLVRTFKKMKDYILENRELIGQRELLQLSMETANNRIEISKINSDMISIEKQISDVVEGLKDVVTKSELADMMNSFISDDDEKWLMYNAKFSSADEVYASIYRQAKVSIYVVDNYIGLRTLVHLKNSQSGVSIILFSDNVGNNKLHNIEFTDFCKEYPNVKISMQKTGEIFHDRFIVLDYGTADERVFLCGASSKDAGARITSIVEDYGTKKYASVMATLLQNPPLVLPK